MLGRLTIASPYSEKDCELFREIAPNACVQAIQPWFSKLDVQVRREPQQPGKAKNVLFWGALTRPENQDCVRFTLDEILPRIRKLIPDVHYYAAGAVSDELRSEWSQAGVTVTGFVDDVPGLFSKMDVALLPLRLGAGIKIKVLESFSAGLAVVTSHVGIEGIPALEGFHYLLGTSAEEYAEHVARLLSNPAAAHEMGRAAQEFIRSHFAFDNSAESLAQSLIACLLRSAASITTGPEVETSGANQPK